MLFCVATAWAPDCQIFNIWDLKSVSGYDKNSGAQYFCFWTWGLLTLLWEETATEQALPPAPLLGFEDLSVCQTFSANSSNTSSNVNYAYRSGTWIFAISDSFTLLLKKTSFLWTSVIQEAFSHHDVAFTSTPVLFHPDSAQPFIVKSDCLSQVAEAILSQRRPSLFLECAFHFFS